MTELRPQEEILVAEPGVLFTSETDDVAAFSQVTQFGMLITAHTREGKDIFRADRVLRDKVTGNLLFDSRGIRYQAREFTDEDGLWLSRYKIDLPDDALAGLTTQGNAENMDTPETLTGYFDGGFLVALVYTNNQGTWLREDSQWIPISPEDDGLDGEDITSFEADPEQAADLIDLFDTQYATEEEARPFGIRGA